MKQRITSWWNGKTLVEDDGYVPFVITRPPWFRRFCDQDKTGFWTILAMLLTPLWTELFNVFKTILLTN